MAVSKTTVRKRVTEILNACSPGTFSEAVDINYQDRNSQAIEQAVTEAALLIARAIVINPNHVHRNLFVGSVSGLSYAEELPDMSGEPEVVLIKPYSTASGDGEWRVGIPRDVQQIQDFRINANDLYSNTAHDAQGSPLSGYYAIQNGRIYFTGYQARMYFPLISSATVTGLIPDEYEPTWVCLAVGLTVKEGDNLAPIAQYYYQIGMSDLAMVSNMATVQPVPDAELARQARGDA